MELDSGCCKWLCPKILIRKDILANYSDLFPPSSHLKWWFRIRVITPIMPLIQVQEVCGIILICPEKCMG